MSFKNINNIQMYKILKREWADKTITHAPIYCSVDLRDGNQALINPLTVEQNWSILKL